MRRGRSSMVVTVLLATGIGLLVQAKPPQICNPTGECLVWRKNRHTGEEECTRYAKECRDARCIRKCMDTEGKTFCCEYESDDSSTRAVFDEDFTPAVLPTDGPTCEPEPVDTQSECAAKLAGEKCPGNCDNCGASKYTDCCEQKTLKHGTTWALCGKVDCTCPSSCNRP